MKAGVFITGLTAVALAGVAQADVRVVHASPDAPPVDVYVNETPGAGSPAIEDLAFTQATPYIPLPTDNYTFNVTAANMTDTVLSASSPIDGNTDYSIVASDFLASIGASIYVDDNTIDLNNARVRFIHQSPDAPAVDIFANNSIELFDAVSFTESGGYQSVAPGDYLVDVRLDSDGTTVLDDLDLTFEAGNVYTVFAMGSAAQGTLEAVVYTDATIPAPGALAVLGLAGIGLRRRRRRD